MVFLFIHRSFPFSSTTLQKGEKLAKEVLIVWNAASDYVTRKQLLAHVDIIMKHAPIYNRHDVSACTSLHRQPQIDFGCFSIVICDNTAAFPCKRYC